MIQYTMKQLLSMTIGKQRKILTALNKEARLRAGRLVKAGYSGEMTRPPTVNASKLPKESLVRAIEDLQIYTRNPLSRVSGMKRFENKTITTLEAHGYDFVNKDNLSDFGNFMNMVRDIHGAKSFPSNEVAQMYKQKEKLGISNRVIKEKFGEYLASQEGLTDLKLTLDEIRLPEGRRRISSTEVMAKMEELGF